MLLPRIVPGSEDEFDKMFLEHGAVLLRGFNFTTAEEFATFYANNPGFKCLHDYFPAEHGRDEVYVSSRSGFTVWPTNSLTLTGGYLTPEVVPHTENYYAVRGIPDVLAFCCERAPWFGGETALFDGYAAFGALPIPLQQKLEQPCAIRRFLSWERLFERHGIASEAELEQQLDGTGARQLPLPASSGYVALEFAREVLTEEDGIQFNFGELNNRAGAREALLSGLLKRGFFSGRSWRFHRLLWSYALRHPATIGKLLRFIDSVPCWLTRPLGMLKATLERRGAAKAEAALLSSAIAKKPARRRRSTSPSSRRRRRELEILLDDQASHSPPPPPMETLGERLTDEEAELIAESLAQNATRVEWQRGDLLIIDNSMILHDGLPGFGPWRKLHVALMRAIERRVK